MPSSLGIVASGYTFTPLVLSPALWLDASDTSTITASSNKVSQWNDKSGNGRHMTQATAAAQPTTGANTQNGRNVLAFNGSNWLKSAANTTNSVATIFGVGNHTSADLGGRFFCGYTGTGFQANLYPYRGTFGVIENAELFAGSTVSGPVGSVLTNTYYYATWKLDGASSRVWVNGSPGTAGSAGANSASIGTVGARGDNAFPFIGYIAEIVVVFSAVSDATRGTVETYLKSKWGL